MRAFVSGILLLLMFPLGCSDSPFPQAPLHDKPPAKSAGSSRREARSLGHLVTRDREVEILSHSRGLFFTVKTKAARVIASNLTLANLQTIFPELHRTVKSSHADSDAIWAGM